MIECFSHCGECAHCRSGHYNHCLERAWVSREAHGGFADFTTAHASGIFKISSAMSWTEAALVEPLAVAVRTLTQAEAGYLDRLLIIGGGTIGLLCLAVAIAAGVKETLVVAKYPQQAEMARVLGAGTVIVVGQNDVRQAISDRTCRLGADVIIETVGTAEAFEDSLAVVRNRGRVVLVAGYHGPLSVNLSRMVWSEAVVTGSNCYGLSGMRSDFQTAIDMISTGQVDITKIVTHTYSFSDIRSAFAVAADKESGSIKVHIVNG